LIVEIGRRVANGPVYALFSGTGGEEQVVFQHECMTEIMRTMEIIMMIDNRRDYPQVLILRLFTIVVSFASCA
jgi:hypothetical protein